MLGSAQVLRLKQHANKCRSFSESAMAIHRRLKVGRILYGNSFKPAARLHDLIEELHLFVLSVALVPPV